MKRQPQHRGEASLNPSTSLGSSHSRSHRWIQGTLVESGSISYLITPKGAIAFLKLKSNVIKPSLWLIYATIQLKGQQISHTIKNESPRNSNQQSPTRKVHWPVLQPLRLWRFLRRPASQASGFSCIPAPCLPHIWLT